MTSPSEHLYRGFSLAALAKAPKLRSGLLFLFLAFIAMRAGSFVPLPGVNTAAWAEFWQNSPLAQLGGLF